MGRAKLVNAGVDTLVLNAFYTDERGRPVKYDLDESLRLQDSYQRKSYKSREVIVICQVKGFSDRFGDVDCACEKTSGSCITL